MVQSDVEISWSVSGRDSGVEADVDRLSMCEWTSSPSSPDDVGVRTSDGCREAVRAWFTFDDFLFFRRKLDDSFGKTKDGIDVQGWDVERSMFRVRGWVTNGWQ